MPELKSSLKPKVFSTTPSGLIRLFQWDSLEMKDKNLNLVCYTKVQGGLNLQGDFRSHIFNFDTGLT